MQRVLSRIQQVCSILSDILGDEDHLGDSGLQDYGYKRRSYSHQMDIMRRIVVRNFEKALMQAKAGREHILNLLTETIAEPRAEMKPQVPRIIQPRFLWVHCAIGPGGKMIQQMQEETGATITIEETEGGRTGFAPNKDAIDAPGKIKAIATKPDWWR